MPPASRFARNVFRWSGIYGLVSLLPLYFLEDALGRAFPPAFSRPEQFYGFLGVAVAWQLAFLLIASDVRRYRAFMLPAAAEKFLSAIAVIALYAGDRVTLATAVPYFVDLVLGGLFVASYVRCAEQPHAPRTA